MPAPAAQPEFAAAEHAVSAVLPVFEPAMCCYLKAGFLSFLNASTGASARINMRKLLISLALGSAIAALPAITSAKGCLKGAAVGGVAGHVAGHHGLVGAAAGCAIEHHREKVRDKAAAKTAVPTPEKALTPMSTNTDTPAK